MNRHPPGGQHVEKGREHRIAHPRRHLEQRRVAVADHHLQLREQGDAGGERTAAETLVTAFHRREGQVVEGIDRSRREGGRVGAATTQPGAEIPGVQRIPSGLALAEDIPEITDRDGDAEVRQDGQPRQPLRVRSRSGAPRSNRAVNLGRRVSQGFERAAGAQTALQENGPGRRERPDERGPIARVRGGGVLQPFEQSKEEFRDAGRRILPLRAGNERPVPWLAWKLGEVEIPRRPRWRRSRAVLLHHGDQPLRQEGVGPDLERILRIDLFRAPLEITGAQGGEGVLVTAHHHMQAVFFDPVERLGVTAAGALAAEPPALAVERDRVLSVLFGRAQPIGGGDAGRPAAQDDDFGRCNAALAVLRDGSVPRGQPPGEAARPKPQTNLTEAVNRAARSLTTPERRELHLRPSVER